MASAEVPLWALIDYVTGYVMREGMLCFEGAMDLYAKARLEKHFPEDPARTAERKALDTKLSQCEADLVLLLDREKDYAQHMKNQQAWAGQSQALMKKEKKKLSGDIKKTKQAINANPVRYVAECR